MAAPLELALDEQMVAYLELALDEQICDEAETEWSALSEEQREQEQELWRSVTGMDHAWRREGRAIKALLSREQMRYVVGCRVQRGRSPRRRSVRDVARARSPGRLDDPDKPAPPLGRPLEDPAPRAKLLATLVLEAFEVGDQRYACELCLSELEDGPAVLRCRCEDCGAHFEWPGLLKAHWDNADHWPLEEAA